MGALHNSLTMYLLLVLSFVTLSVCNPNTSRGFASLVASLQDDDSIDMEEILNSESIYINAKSQKTNVFYSDVELLVGEEEEMVDELNEDYEEKEDDSEPDISDYPEELDARDLGIMHGAIFQGGYCGSCGWVSGTQTLEARIALVSENYIPYSIQNLMNCAGKTCAGSQPYAVNTQTRKKGFIVPENEIPYTKNACKIEGDRSACYEKCGSLHPDNFTNALHDQFVVIAGTRSAHSKAQLIAALQGGPATTCFQRGGRLPGEKCRNGCNHANSIIGYTKNDLIVQDSYGKKWGNFKDGTWITPKDSICGAHLITKAYYPNIVYDYDRANAYYTQIDAGVNETNLTLVNTTEYGITVNNTKNWGTAKNKCAFLGSTCKGVVALSSGTFELVSDFGTGSQGAQKAFRKFQMVVYLKHEQTGRYIGILKKNGNVTLLSVTKNQASPFFTSYGRFVFFDHPTYHMVGNTLQPITGTIRDIALNFEVNKEWYLSNCMIYNAVSDKSFDLTTKRIGKKVVVYLGSAAMNKTAPSQRFNVGISGTWNLTSKKLGIALAKTKEGEFLFTREKKNKKTMTIGFLWQARQMMSWLGNAIGPDMQFSDFKFNKTSENEMTPTDCTLSTLSDNGDESYLALDNGKIVMNSRKDKSGWTFEYGDL